MTSKPSSSSTGCDIGIYHNISAEKVLHKRDLAEMKRCKVLLTREMSALINAKKSSGPRWQHLLAEKRLYDEFGRAWDMALRTVRYASHPNKKTGSLISGAIVDLACDFASGAISPSDALSALSECGEAMTAYKKLWPSIPNEELQKEQASRYWDYALGILWKQIDGETSTIDTLPQDDAEARLEEQVAHILRSGWLLRLGARQGRREAADV